MDRKLVVAIALSVLAGIGVVVQLTNVLAAPQGWEPQDDGNWLQDRTCTQQEIDYARSQCRLRNAGYVEGSCYAWGGKTGDENLHFDCFWLPWDPCWIGQYHIPDCGVA